MGQWQLFGQGRGMGFVEVQDIFGLDNQGGMKGYGEGEKKEGSMA